MGAGKTTFARRLEAELGAIRFTHDEWMSRLYGPDPPQASFALYAERVSSLIETVWLRCLDLKLDVVLDLNFWSRLERDRTRRLSEKAGAGVRLYRLTCLDAEAWARIEARNADLNGNLFIARNTFDLLRSRFEPLSDDEERIEIVA